MAGPGAPGTARDAVRPRLSLEWLSSRSDVGASVPIDQPLTFQRSTRLQSDWDIGLGLPSEAAKLSPAASGTGMRLGVAKLVYFDDLVADGRLDWSCRGTGCDQVKAVSAEFVLFLDASPACPQTLGAPAGKAHLAPGYHYYSMDGGTVHEVSGSQPFTLTLTAGSLDATNPSSDLRAFMDIVLRAWAASGLTGC